MRTPRGLQGAGIAVVAPEIAVGDGALGFWKVFAVIFPTTRHQRCWVHKVANVLNKVPKLVQRSMKTVLVEVQAAPDRAITGAAVAVFIGNNAARYPRAVECLKKDADGLLAFFESPAKHWDDQRTLHPIKSVFATVRHQTVRKMGALSRRTARLMVCKLAGGRRRHGVN